MLSGRGTDERLPKGFTPPKRQTWSPAFSSTNPASVRIIYRVRTCVIFNPAARGEKARHFRRHLDKIASRGALKVTAIPGDARRLAGEAVAEGFELIVAAGGDGTVNEVLNGIGDTRDGFARARLGVLPLGTINVFAREIGLPLRIEQAWETLLRGRETRLDLPCAEEENRAAGLCHGRRQGVAGPAASNYRPGRRTKCHRRTDPGWQRTVLRRAAGNFPTGGFARWFSGYLRFTTGELADLAALPAGFAGTTKTTRTFGATIPRNCF
jgi:hypothetical protein